MRYKICSILSLVILLVFPVALFGQQMRMTWPDAISPLAGERAQAETCAGVLKRYGTAPQIARGQLSYGRAKSDSDAVIAGLITALATGDTLGSLPSLQAKLASSLQGLSEFCNSVSDLLNTTSGQRDIWSALLKVAPIEQLLKTASEGVAALYNNYRSDDALTRKTIQTQLEAARWPDFTKIEASY
jgi:hypothetical protein